MSKSTYMYMQVVVTSGSGGREGAARGLRL